MEKIDTFKIHSLILPSLVQKIEKLNRKAKKLNQKQIELNTIESETIVQEYGRADLFHTIEIIGERPQIQDYKFIAKLEHLEKGNLIHSMSELPETYRNKKSHCDHCKTNRKRKYTYVIQNTISNKFLQVGKTCLSDFLPSTNIEQIATYFEAISKTIDEFLEAQEQSEDELYLSSIGGHYYSLKYFLYIVAETIKKHGWISKTKAFEENKHSTSVIAWGIMLNSKNIKISDESKEIVQKSMDWAVSLKDKESKNDYEHNIFMLAENNIVDSKTRGFGASIIVAYQKHLQYLKRQEEKHERQKLEKQSQYFGEIKERKLYTLKVLSKTYLESDYGVTVLHRMADQSGNIAIWFSSSKSLEEGEEYTLKATIKEHNEYKGIKQTILTRCKVA